jgi:predicted flap endonuclease-1-like 5' DNA nuclease
MATLREIQGVDEGFAAKLRASGVHDTAGLVKAGATRTARNELSEKTGVDEHQLLHAVGAAELSQVGGVTAGTAELLEQAGVMSLAELAQRNADHLTVKLNEINQARHIVKSIPPATTVASWITQAKTMPHVVMH